MLLCRRRRRPLQAVAAGEVVRVEAAAQRLPVPAEGQPQQEHPQVEVVVRELRVAAELHQQREVHLQVEAVAEEVEAARERLLRQPLPQRRPRFNSQTFDWPAD